MKKVILLCLIAACAGQLKAQQPLKSIYDSVKISQNIGKFKFDSLRVNLPSVKLQELIASNKQPDFITNTSVYKASPDNMPVVVPASDSRMPVMKLHGNDNMPVVKLGNTDNGALIKLLKPTPAVKVPEALFPAPQK